jgi:ATP-dependent Clp protease ATP-binding subunit ClpX
MTKKEDDNDNLFCSFCGKNQKEVKKLIAGPAVYICDECIQLCSEIIEEESEKDADAVKNCSPKEIKTMLDDYVIEQDAGQENSGGGGLQPLQAPGNDRQHAG